MYVLGANGLVLIFSAAQVDSIIANHQVYMLNSGRISLAGLNDKNIPHVAKAIHAVVTGQ